MSCNAGSLRILQVWPAGRDWTPAKTRRWWPFWAISFVMDVLPPAKPLPTRLASPPDEVRSALESLRRRDLVVLDQFDASIRAAYPFAAYSTGHRITLSGQATDSLCAIDALGAGAMCETQSSIDSKCAHCDVPIHITTSGGGHRAQGSGACRYGGLLQLGIRRLRRSKLLPQHAILLQRQSLGCVARRQRRTHDRRPARHARSIGDRDCVVWALAEYGPLLRPGAAAPTAERADASGEHG